MKKRRFSSPFLLPVSVVVPMRNSETTIGLTLGSTVSQKYPIREIFVFDNNSTDQSVELVKKFQKKCSIPISLIRRKDNKGLSASYNEGVALARSDLVVFVHSDSTLPTTKEIKKLVQPLYDREDVVATYPTAILPRDVWERFTFWEKCHFSRVAGVETTGFNGKFDCIRRSIFLKLGGFDTTNFIGKGVGGEDADFYLRLQTVGHVVLSSARVTHLHYLGKEFSLYDWIRIRKLLARTYGRLLRLHGNRLPLSTTKWGLSVPLGWLVFMIKPILAILPLLPWTNILGISLLLIYTLVKSWRIYTTISTLRDLRVLTLPFIDIYLIYYETFWMLESFLFLQKK